MPLGAYTQILGKRQVQVVVGASVLAGLNVGIPLAVVLMVQHETGDFASAGAVAGCAALANAATGPLRGRLVDAVGQSRTLPPLALIEAAALAALVAATQAGAPLAVLIALALVEGGVSAPLLSSMRPLWADLVDDRDQLPSAYAIQAILLEVFFISGPLVAAALIAVGSPAAAVLALGACRLLGVLAFAATPASRGWRAPPRDVGRAGALASAGMRALILVDVPFGALFGTLDVAVPAFTKAHGAAAAAGAALAALAVASMLGGVVYGARSGGADRRADRYAMILAGMTVLMIPLALVDSIAGLIAAMALAGILVAPSSALGLSLLDDVAPAGTASEATSWVSTAYGLGLAIGTAVTGPLVDGSGTTPAFAAAIGLCALGALIAFAARPTLRVHAA
jgi:MFS family permease